jgi:DNA-binding transcriptional ArsR family regulator
MRQMRGIDRTLRREIDRFGWMFRTHVPDAFLPIAQRPLESFENELFRMRAIPPHHLVSAFARPLFDHGGDGTITSAARTIALERSATFGARARATAAILFDEPSVFAADLAGLLHAYSEEVFEREWRRLEETLARSIAEANGTLARGDAWLVLGRLPANCRVASDELFVDLPHEHAVDASSERPLVLIPSFFAWPHLVVNCDGPWPLAIAYTAPPFAREAEPRIPPADLVTTMRALADDSRLRILKLIAERPRTSQELEPLVGLSRAGLSKALRRLAEAGLISGKREGFYVVYSLEPARVRAVTPELAEYIGP